MFLRLSLLAFIGLAAAQTTPSPVNQCYDGIIATLAQYTQDIQDKLGELETTVDNSTTFDQVKVGPINAISKIQEYSTSLSTARDSLKNVFDLILVPLQVATDIIKLPFQIAGNTIGALTNVLSGLTDFLPILNTLATPKLNEMSTLITNARNFIQTNEASINSCLISKYPLLGPILGPILG